MRTEDIRKRFDSKAKYEDDEYKKLGKFLLDEIVKRDVEIEKLKRELKQKKLFEE